MKKLILLGPVTLAFSLLLSSCWNCFWLLGIGGCRGSKMVSEATSPKTSLVFGYLDMDEAPSKLDWVDMKQVHPKIDKPYYHMRLDKGLFYFENVPPGSYQLSGFGSNGGFWSNTMYKYNIPRQSSEEARLIIKNPGIYYMGTFKFKKVKTGFFEKEKFDLEAVNSPGEKELLQQLLPYSKGTQWENRIQKRLKVLS
ncbi:MAG: hypothetical protein L0Y56_17735 [Nitrospira sp.]|nr:hypothetical protein [Nitrospira sp.]